MTRTSFRPLQLLSARDKDLTLVSVANEKHNKAFANVGATNDSTDPPRDTRVIAILDDPTRRRWAEYSKAAELAVKKAGPRLLEGRAQ